MAAYIFSKFLRTLALSRLTAQLYALSFLFENHIQSGYESIVFVFLVHPTPILSSSLCANALVNDAHYMKNVYIDKVVFS